MSKFNLKQFITENKIGPYSKLNEAGPGFAHDCAAHVVHETYGHGICLEGQHTLVENKEGNHIVTHYDVFFKEGSKTVENIPVEELEIITESHHSHGKNKKKNERLDPVGKEDGDIDNDGDKDETDKYLANRRKAIAKAIADKEKTDTEKDARKAKGMMEGDLDVGHQDDEPGMLKNKLFRAAKMAAMLYKKVDKYDKMGGEVDFPSWWQNKINKSQDMLQSAYDYLDGEENVAKLDAMAEDVEEMKHPQYGTASNKYASRANRPGGIKNSPELDKDLKATAKRAMDILKRKGMSEKKVEVDDETEFKLNLRHLLDKHAQ